jgi:proteasome lid subunit RPN8/RPN11
VMRALCLSTLHVADLVRRARATSPLECCGVLLGLVRGGIAVVEQVVPLNNTDRRPGRFSISDTEFRRARQAAAETRLDLLAILHSHAVGAAIPSSADREALRYSEYPWVILGFGPTGEPEVRAFASGQGVPIPVRVAESGVAEAD